MPIDNVGYDQIWIRNIIWISNIFVAIIDFWARYTAVLPSLVFFWWKSVKIQLIIRQRSDIQFSCILICLFMSIPAISPGLINKIKFIFVLKRSLDPFNWTLMLVTGWSCWLNITVAWNWLQDQSIWLKLVQSGLELMANRHDLFL